eukprot:TRINITY_DN16255_c0_g1_i1.p1 TRINITY_DN16255_c0_g1~~TRINITY_DN16255_c0_g1_i1.p1  ORF type:complete len:341 (-),score=60.96 TRINITY_DN16255_c0_g1_i1:71-1093(-)
MFMDVCLSTLGRSTEVQISALRKTLRVDLGTAKPPVSESSLRPTRSEPTLRPVEGQPEAASTVGDWPRFAQIRQTRKLREDLRGTSAFRAVGRQERERLSEKCRADAPPVGTYTPKDDCCASFSRVKHPPAKVASFGLREATRSLKRTAKETELRRLQDEGLNCDDLMRATLMGRELPEVGIVENTLAQRRLVVKVDISKQTGRPDIVKAANIVYHDPVAISTRGFAEAHTRLAQFGKHYRQPCFDFAKQSTHKPKPPDSYTQPGEYKPNIAFVRPRIGQGNLPFEKRPSRKDIFEGSERPGDHLPDRSLARDNPNLTQFSRMKSPAAPVPDLGKNLPRK